MPPFRTNKELKAFATDDGIVVNVEFIASFFNLTRASISYWRDEKGLEQYKNQANWYNLAYVIDWHKKNIDKTKSRSSRNKPQSTTSTISQDFIDTLPEEVREAYQETGKDPLDALKDIKEIQKRDIAIKEALGKLVPAERLDYGMAELAVIQIGQYQSDKRTLPHQLENKSSDEIKDILDNHYQSRVEEIIKIAKKGFGSTKKIYDVVVTLKNKLKEHSADDIIKHLDDL